MTSHRAVAGVRLEIEERGAGRPLLFLHPGEGLRAADGWIDPLAGAFRVTAPHHPGFGGSDLPDWFGTVEDLAYLYLELLRDMGVDGAVVAGSSFGGWIAAEMAVRDTRRIAGLILADPLGIKVRGRTDRDIADMHSIPRAEYLRLAWADPAKGETDFAKLPDTELAAIARGREAFALFGWKPYMHNPRLRPWLRRIDVPTLLLWGESDGIVARSYVEAFQAGIPGTALRTVPGAGHYPHLEQPAAFAAIAAEFAASLR